MLINKIDGTHAKHIFLITFIVVLSIKCHVQNVIVPKFVVTTCLPMAISYVLPTEWYGKAMFFVNLEKQGKQLINR